MADAPQAVEAPPYDLDVVAVDFPETASPETLFCALPADQFVDEAAAVSRMPPRASLPGERPVTVTIALRGHAMQVGVDGWAADGEGEMPFDDLLADLWAVYGWDVFEEARLEVAGVAARPGVDAQVVNAAGTLSTCVDTCEAALRTHVVEFLVTLEANMLALLASALEDSQAQAQAVRARYLEPAATPAAGPTPLEDLHEYVKVLIKARAALLQHERHFAQLATPVTAVTQLAFPWKLATLLPLPTTGADFDAFGPVLGPKLAQWWSEEVQTYEAGRDRLLRASAFYYSLARESHPIVRHVWTEFDSDPGIEGLARRIGELCTEVTASSQKALDGLRNGQAYRLLLQHVTIAMAEPLSASLGMPRVETASGTAAELMGLRTAKAPEAALAGLMAARATSVTRLAEPLAQAVNPVTVWDLDALRATTLEKMGDQVGPVEAAALQALEWDLLVEMGATLAKDFAIRRALDFGLAPAGLGVVVDALLDVLDGVYDYVSYRDQLLLAKSELLAASGATRKILTTDPSWVPLFLDAVGVAGDVAAIAKWPRVARLLRELHLDVFIASTAADVAPLIVQWIAASLKDEER